MGMGLLLAFPGPAFPHRSSNTGLRCSQTQSCILHVLRQSSITNKEQLHWQARTMKHNGQEFK